MPELPEIRAHAQRLSAAYGDARLERFDALTFTACKTAAPDPGEVVGRQLDLVDQRGKYLVLRFGERAFVVHLMQGGRLRDDAGTSVRPRNGLARWRFDDDRCLLLTEAGKEHRAGVWVIAGDPTSAQPLSRLGPDADGLSRTQLTELTAQHSMRVHRFLRDQGIVAGIGRRLANEVCHTARLSPFANAAKLAPEELHRLHEAIGSCIETSLAYERTRDDMSSSKDRPGRVHHRDGDACEVCGDTVRAVRYSSYTVYYCAACQTGGKVLADNTTSKFLK